MSRKSASRPQALKSVRQFQSEVAAIRETEEPFSAKITVHVLSAMVVALTIVLIFARVDRVVTSEGGKTVTTTPASIFQALDPSIIKSIDVKEGQFVAKGEVLATLDPTFATSAVDQLKSQIDALQAQIVRDRAELSESPLDFPKGDDPGYAGYVKLQSDLYTQQMAQYRAQVKSYDQKIALAEVTIAKYTSDEQRYHEEKDIAQQIEDMRTTLEQHGTGSLLNRLTSTDSRVEAARTMELDHNSMIESEHSLASLQADRDAFVQQFRSTAAQDLATASATLDGAKAQLDSALKHRDLVRLTAKEDSIVLTIAKLSVGSVLKEGDELMTLTPARAPIEAEVKISARDVGFVRAGDPVTIKVDAFNFAEHGTIEGKVRWISEDAFIANELGAPADPYYKARIAIGPIHLIGVPASFRLMPGMTLAADIKVGSRSLANYVVGGMIHGAGEAMREP